MHRQEQRLQRFFSDPVNRWQIAISVAFLILAVLFVTSLVTVGNAITRLQSIFRDYTDAQGAKLRVASILQNITDAETGQRGFLLTQREEYLRPYSQSVSAIENMLSNPGAFIASNQDTQRAFLYLSRAAEDKLHELRYTLNLAQTVSFPSAINYLNEDRGKNAMDVLRTRAYDLDRVINARLEYTLSERANLLATLRGDLVFSTIFLTILLLLAYLLGIRSLDATRRERILKENRTEELELAVRARTAELTEAVKELEGFTYSVSHDMRAPLRWIVGSSQMLLEDHAGGLSEEARQMLKRQIVAGNKLSHLIDDLLTYARLARKPMDREPLDLAAMARRLLSGESDVKIDAPPELMGVGDPEMLETVLQNLLENALKYRSKERPLTITIGEVNTEKGRAYFVRDNGIGFDPKYLEKIFLPFERLHRDAEYPGTGIGLANVQRIIERHGGKVWAGSEPDAGATFFFTLP